MLSLYGLCYRCVHIPSVINVPIRRTKNNNHDADDGDNKLKRVSAESLQSRNEMVNWLGVRTFTRACVSCALVTFSALSVSNTLVWKSIELFNSVCCICACGVCSLHGAFVARTHIIHAWAFYEYVCMFVCVYVIRANESAFGCVVFCILRIVRRHTVVVRVACRP